MSERIYPYLFTAIVGQENLKLGLILNIIDGKIGGILAFGEKGTAKSTAIRAIAGLLPKIKYVSDCRFGCDPDDISTMCSECKEKYYKKIELKTSERKMRVVDLPVSATEDRVVGTLDLEEAIKKGNKRFEPGILAEANRGILYIDEVNLLDDHIVDLLLDSAAMGVNTVEREGVSFSHPASFILVGTMNPEEGELIPQLLDRFGLSIRIEGIKDPEDRVKIIKYRSEYDADPEKFISIFRDSEEALIKKILHARNILDRVEISDDKLLAIAKVSVALEVDGHRSDLTMMKAARAYAAFEGRYKVEYEDIKKVAEFVYMHRMRRLPFEQAKDIDMDIIDKIIGTEV